VWFIDTKLRIFVVILGLLGFSGLDFKAIEKNIKKLVFLKICITFVPTHASAFFIGRWGPCLYGQGPFFLFLKLDETKSNKKFKEIKNI